MRAEDLEFHVMVYLAVCNDWKHGYPLKDWLERQRGIDVPLQSLYRIIKKLHQEGMVDFKLGGADESYAGIPRKYYRLNTAGHQVLAERVQEVQAVVLRLQKSIEQFSQKVVSNDKSRRTI